MLCLGQKEKTLNDSRSAHATRAGVCPPLGTRFGAGRQQAAASLHRPRRQCHNSLVRQQPAWAPQPQPWAHLKRILGAPQRLQRRRAPCKHTRNPSRTLWPPVAGAGRCGAGFAPQGGGGELKGKRRLCLLQGSVGATHLEVCLGAGQGDVRGRIRHEQGEAAARPSEARRAHCGRPWDKAKRTAATHGTKRGARSSWLRARLKLRRLAFAVRLPHRPCRTCAHSACGRGSAGASAQARPSVISACCAFPACSSAAPRKAASSAASSRFRSRRRTSPSNSIPSPSLLPPLSRG
jgi:hypothetical protein